MKIALLSETWHPYTNGVITHIDVLAEGLRELGHDVLIVTADPEIRHHVVDTDGVLRCPALAVKRIYGYGLAAPFSLKRYEVLRRFQPDIIHIHMEFGIGTFGLLASRLLRVPLVYTLHTAYDEYLHYLAAPPLIPVVRAISRGYVKLLATAASMSTGPSEKAAAYLKARRVPTPFVSIPNSVDHQRFNPQLITQKKRLELRQTYGIGEDDTVAIFVGRLGREKSVSELVDFWKQAVPPGSGIHLLLVGEGPERAALEKTVAINGLAQQIHFTGKVPYEEMPAYYGAANVFVSASTTEMMSIALLEAQAMGLPVLQRHDAWNRQQVEDGVNGFTYTDAVDFAKHMHYFSRLDVSGQENWRQRCCRHVAHQGASDLAGRLLRVYQQALAICERCAVKESV
ncbi:MAG: glycosyltransferase [Bacillota bacterium]|nr:glycosyltransferase [Bacillota bacterium]